METYTSKLISSKNVFLGEIVAVTAEAGGKLWDAVCDVALAVLWRGLVAVATFLLWPLVPGLLWDWSAKTEISSIGALIEQRAAWLFFNEGVRSLILFALICAILWRGFRVLRSR